MLRTQSAWLGNQIKAYVNNTIPSWGNLSNNPTANRNTASVNTKPALNINYIAVIDSYFVQPVDEANPFTVKPIYSEEY